MRKVAKNMPMLVDDDSDAEDSDSESGVAMPMLVDDDSDADDSDSESGVAWLGRNKPSVQAPPPVTSRPDWLQQSSVQVPSVQAPPPVTSRPDWLVQWISSSSVPQPPQVPELLVPDRKKSRHRKIEIVDRNGNSKLVRKRKKLTESQKKIKALQQKLKKGLSHIYTCTAVSLFDFSSLFLLSTATSKNSFGPQELLDLELPELLKRIKSNLTHSGSGRAVTNLATQSYKLAELLAEHGDAQTESKVSDIFSRRCFKQLQKNLSPSRISHAKDMANGIGLGTEGLNILRNLVSRDGFKYARTFVASNSTVARKRDAFTQGTYSHCSTIVYTCLTHTHTYSLQGSGRSYS